jgi:hypothetical protein
MSYTGPYHTDTYITWGPGHIEKQYAKNQDSYKTDPGSRRVALPYNTRLSFYSTRTTWGRFSNWYVSCDQWGNEHEHPEGRLWNDSFDLVDRARNRARSKFISKLRQDQSSSIGETLGEWHEGFTMIASRLRDLYYAYHAVKSGNIRLAQNFLTTRAPKGWRELVKQPSQLWLEWHFGWSPLLSDIYGAMQALSSPLPLLQKIRVRASAFYDFPYQKVTDTGFIKIHMGAFFSSKSRIEGFARLVSPSVGLLDQLGLLNPVEVAWNLVPMSFLVDHITGIGNFIGSYTDTLGWELHDITVTTLDQYEFGRLDYDVASTEAEHYDYGTYHDGCYGMKMSRSAGLTGLPLWALQFSNPFRDLSVARGATYAALLAQLLRS